MSVLTRILLALTVGVVIALLVFSASVYGDLPARIPTHFNASGTPDGFGARSNWWLLPIVCVVSTILSTGVALLVPRRPDLLNLPSKPEILALPPAAQQAVVRQAQPGLLLLGLMVSGVMAFLQYGAWQVTQGHGSGGIGSLLLVVPIVSLALIPVVLMPVNAELRRQQAALAARKT